MGRRMLLVVGVLAFAACVAAAGAEKKKKPALKIVPVSKEEKAKLLAAESPQQKALREQLKKMKGKIAFSSNMDGTRRIYIMNVDGSDVKCLTPAPGPGGDYPHISPDGKKILFQRSAPKDVIRKMPCAKGYKKNYVKSCIYVMNIDGTDCKPVAAGTTAHWSWDGKKIIYGFQTIGRAGYGKAAILDLETNTERVISPPRTYRPIHFGCFVPGKHMAILSNSGYALLVWLNDKDNGPATPPKYARIVFGHPCNLEVSNDGKWWVWVIDTYGDYGSWLFYAKARYDGRGVGRGKRLPLGWPDKSINYFPDFSPDGKYLVYSHADMQKGIKSYHIQTKEELYITTFPDCKVTVRITWNGAGNMHPHWWGPSAQ